MRREELGTRRSGRGAAGKPCRGVIVHRLFLLLAALVTCVGVLPTRALAAGAYPPGSSGYDISYPQSSGPYPSLPSPPYVFGIVGVTDGRAFTQNPYLASQYAWASKGTSAATLYMNLNAPVGSTVNGNTSTPKTCAHNDKVCQAYNYGYHAAAAAFTYASGQGATSSMWWLDIETGNSWSSKTAVNAAVIQGAIDSLNGASVAAGIYSTPSMWATIVGTAVVSPEPGWIGGYNTGHDLCGTTVFSGGGAILVQQAPSNGVDTDYAC